MGFTMPLARWQKTNLSDDLKNLPIKVLDATDGIIDYDILREITNKHLKGKKNYYQLIHSFNCFHKMER